ncbi:hypothetical protein AAV97_17250 [Acinetobacter sp. Ag2]|uniref:hypothetical protein n=1 Tax=Acinetobacter sp. Ag2 TaxID=1646532 RepID=UPI0006290D8D|nr:hypothetical protein [Acinetobacter sp. Ag2]KKW76141.1 hypothetical protein AAV97_17250 [Acinetobacter sp. Ag2]
MISQYTLNLISFLSGIFTIIAAIATLIALFFAWRMWKTWKLQQTYAFHREKLIENEINIIALFNYQNNTIKQIFDMKLSKLKSELKKSDEIFYSEVLDNINKKQEVYEDKYAICRFTLDRYNILYPKHLVFDIANFNKETMNLVKKIENIDNVQELKQIFENYIFESASKKDKLLNELAIFRKDSLK